MTSLYLFSFQLADARDVMEGIKHIKDARFPVLTPNIRVGFLPWKQITSFGFCPSSHQKKITIQQKYT
jgi:hypothetical protein